MDIREKLVELLKYVSKKCQKQGGVTWYDFADHLLANGVTVQTEEEKWNALNEAFDLGVDSVLHDHFGLSWSDAAELRKEVKRLQEATKWIPVTERLPEKSGEYLTYCGDYVGVCVLYYEVLKTKGKWRTRWKEVTHWMPLPQPPKGEIK